MVDEVVYKIEKIFTKETAWRAGVFYRVFSSTDSGLNWTINSDFDSYDEAEKAIRHWLR